MDLVSLKVKCPVCHTSLMDKENLVDNQPGVKMNIHISNPKGCTWHGLSDEDLKYIIFEDCEEW